MARAERVHLIGKIEKARGSRMLTYICADRGPVGAQIGDDAVWPMYDRLRRVGKAQRLDLFLYSRGGAVDVPWKITCMLREFCDTLAVLIPYRAHSAATMIALGCDEIVMGRKAELGPIDPARSRIQQGGDTPIQEEVRVEDVMSYVAFLKEKAGLGDQNALASNVRILSEALTPQVLGSIYRTHAHIRMVARRLLTKHRKAMSDQQINLIIESLAEKTYLHGHAISRGEARDMGLPVEDPPQEVEDLMWALLEDYAQELSINQPVDPDSILGRDRDEAEVPVTLAMIESGEGSAGFKGTLVFQRQRRAPPQVSLNINFGVQLPPGIDPKQVPQEAIAQIMQQVQRDLPRLVQEQLRSQSPPLPVVGKLQNAFWRPLNE